MFNIVGDDFALNLEPLINIGLSLTQVQVTFEDAATAGEESLQDWLFVMMPVSPAYLAEGLAGWPEALLVRDPPFLLWPLWFSLLISPVTTSSPGLCLSKCPSSQNLVPSPLHLQVFPDQPHISATALMPQIVLRLRVAVFTCDSPPACDSPRALASKADK